MNDRFKFRVWLKHSEKMIYIDKKEGDNLYSFLENVNDRQIIMQCTGLKDKNGKLIYEGDILRSSAVLDGLKPTINVVKWNHHCWIGNGTLTEFILEISEVIGNIYENKELLNENS